jgi:tetratricopeptide (TPR) repeat protein
LAEATTSSLEALKANSLGRRVFSEQGAAAALPYDQRSIELDPSFASGYRGAGDTYYDLGERDRASEYLTRAFQLREHASEREQLAIAADYYLVVTGELDKTAQTYQQLREYYPRDSSAYLGLSTAYSGLGQHEKAADIERLGMRLFPNNVAHYENLSNEALALQRFDEVRMVIREAQARQLDDDGLHQTLYVLAFLGQDSGGMTEQQQWFAGKPEFENIGLALASNTETYGGHLGKARDLTKRVVDSAVRADNKESGAVYLANAALREAAVGNAAKAPQPAAAALKLVPASRDVESEAALAFAMAGDTAQADSLSQDLAKRLPLDTVMQSFWLPAIRAKLALDRNDSAFALNTLQAAASPVELGVFGGCLYSTYIRGEAYLAARQGSAAAAEFQKIIDHSGIVWNCWTGALAHLGVARANALQAKTSQGTDTDAARTRALAAYKDFLTLWKDADPDIPILKQANAEYARLQ